MGLYRADRIQARQTRRSAGGLALDAGDRDARRRRRGGRIDRRFIVGMNEFDAGFLAAVNLRFSRELATEDINCPAWLADLRWKAKDIDKQPPVELVPAHIFVDLIEWKEGIMLEIVKNLLGALVLLGCERTEIEGGNIRERSNSDGAAACLRFIRCPPVQQQAECGVAEEREGITMIRVMQLDRWPCAAAKRICRCQRDDYRLGVESEVTIIMYGRCRRPDSTGVCDAFAGRIAYLSV